MFRQLVGLGVLCVFSIGLIGCGGGGGPDLAGVEGKVTYKSQPLAGAMVTFHPTEGPLATGTTGSDGSFTLTTGGRPGAVLGSHKVSVTKASQAAGQTETLTPEDMRKMQMQKMGPGGGSSSDSKSEIPSRYADPNKSGLEATVSSDESKNDFEFPLVD